MSQSSALTKHSHRLLCLSFLALFLSCRSIDKSHTQDIKPTIGWDQVKLPAEPYPFNSMPIELLVKDGEEFFKGSNLPPIVETEHSSSLGPHGVRYMGTNREIAQFIRPGDIFVEFDPIGKAYSDPMIMLQKGMFHAGIVLANRTGGRDLFFPSKAGDAFLCHLDTTSGYDPSGCGFIGPVHFFRIASDPEKVEHYIEKIFGNWNYDYFFKLSAESSSQISELRSSIEKGEKNTIYCSELPFVVHTLALNKLPFEPVPVGRILADWNQFQLKNKQLYSVDLGEKAMSKAIVHYFATFLPSGVQTFIDNPVSRSYVKSALTTPEGSDAETRGIAAKRLAPPWGFMDESKKGSKIVHYVATYYPGEFKAIAIPLNAMRILPEIRAKMDAAQKSLSAASSQVAGAIFVTQVEAEAEGERTKIGRVLQWVRTKPEKKTLLTDFKTDNEYRKKSAKKFSQQLDIAQRADALNYDNYLEICDAFKVANSELKRSRRTLIAALKKTNSDPEVVSVIEREGDGDDMRLQVLWEDFGCSMASHTQLEVNETSSKRIQEIETGH